MFPSAHNFHFADLTLTTWQVTAGQIHLTVIMFPVFLPFPHSLSLSNQFQSFKYQLRCHLLCEAIFETSLSSRSQLLPTLNPYNNLLEFLFYLPLLPLHPRQLEDGDYPLFYYFIPKSRKEVEGSEGSIKGKKSKYQ